MDIFNFNPNAISALVYKIIVLFYDQLMSHAAGFWSMAA